MIYLYRLGVSVALLILPVAAAFNGKLRAGLMMRARRRTRPKFAVRPVWIHAASGEFEYAKAVVRELKARDPEVPIVVTYFSPTYARNVETFPGVDWAEPLPLDLPGPCGAFLDDLEPRACLLARTDFWPEMLTQAGARGIPRVVFAYTRAPVAGWRRWAVRRQLSLVDVVLTVSEADRAATRALDGAKSVEVTGDPRYDQVEYRLQHPRELPELNVPNAPCLVAGSTWGPDEAVLLPALAPLLRQARLKLIVVPHEPTPKHVGDLERALAKLDLVSARLSAGADWSRASVLIVDRTGVLAELYARGEFAFVGGSFKRSVHSVMEALGAGAVTFVGPHHRNNREATEFAGLTIAGRPGLNVVRDADEFRAAIEAYLDDPARGRVGPALRTEFARRLGAARRVADYYRTVAEAGRSADRD